MYNSKNAKLDSIYSTRRCRLQAAGGRQGRLVSFRKANAPRVKLMNLAWGL